MFEAFDVAQTSQILRNVDANKDGFVSEGEFIAACQTTFAQEDDALIERAFELIDTDNDGRLST